LKLGGLGIWEKAEKKNNEGGGKEEYFVSFD